MNKVSSEIHPFYENLDAAISGTEAPREITDQLALVPVEFLGFDNVRRVGQLVVASVLADEVIDIFGKILEADFPVQSIIPAAFFDWDDHRSIAANNTSGFNYRLVPGSDDGLRSMHSDGRAIDINPGINPYLYPERIDPSSRYPYQPYNPGAQGVIRPDSPVVLAFTEQGWEWGGAWEEGPDYQHFEKVLIS